MNTAPQPCKSSWLARRLALGLTPALLILMAIMLLSAGLHFYNISSIGNANAYYTAGVESMLKSWHNFFFVAAEPGGSVTIDKPPLGLWIEAVFAFFLGVSGFSVSLPNILAGILSVPLLYALVRKHLGELAGLVAALVIAITPVALAAGRNNTMDGLLVFVLLLAAWAFLRATETGKPHWLLLGGFIVGLGFNIKMLQAFLPLPAFYALYFFGARAKWGRKLFYLALTSLLLLAVSLAWAVAVDLTPADQRPYIGSSTDNTVMELIVGHNGLNRLFGGHYGGQTVAQAFANTSPDNGGSQAAGGQVPAFQPPAGAPQPGQLPPQGFQDGPRPGDGASGQGNASGVQFQQETGLPGLLRFFQAPLAKEMSWLLPFALVGIVLLALTGKLRLPLESGAHKALLLWGGWLLTCLVFFSAAKFFHAYYMIMLAPALGALVGGGFSRLWNGQPEKSWTRWLLALAAALTIAFQVTLAWQFVPGALWVLIPIGIFALGLILLGFAFLRPGRTHILQAAFAVLLLAMLIIPAAWSGLTVSESSPNVNLPSAYSGSQSAQAGLPNLPGGAGAAVGGAAQSDTALIDYLQANTQDVEYLLAVPSSNSGAEFVLATGRPVLYMGGFTGSDPVIDAAGLGGMVANGELRYVLSGGGQGNDNGIASWLSANCSVVPQFSQAGGSLTRTAVNGRADDAGHPNSGGNVLYLCGE